MSRAVSMFGPEAIEAIKQASFDYVDRLYADAGVTKGMSSEEIEQRISAEHKRRDKLHREQEAEAAFWRAIYERHRRERERGEW